jgi:hypothetical protein
MGTVQPVWPRFRPLAAHRTVDNSSKVTSAGEMAAPETEERFFRAANSPRPPSVWGGGRTISWAREVGGKTTGTKSKKLTWATKIITETGLITSPWVKGLKRRI